MLIPKKSKDFRIWKLNPRIRIKDKNSRSQGSSNFKKFKVDVKSQD